MSRKSPSLIIALRLFSYKNNDNKTVTLQMDTNPARFGTQNVIPGHFRKVDCRLLTALYAVVPVCGICVFLDVVLFNQSLLYHHLPKSPEHWLIWAVVFDMPHIVAGLFSFCDGEYLRHYRIRLLTSICVIVTFVVSVTVVVPLFSSGAFSSALMELFSVVVLIYMMYHVLSQQFGIALALSRKKPNWQYDLSRWGGIIAALLMYLMVATDIGKEIQFNFMGRVVYIATLLIIFLVCVTGLQFSKDANKHGQVFMLANLFMLVGIFLLFLFGYEIFVLMIPRFIHDITAFYVYGVHDHNRNADRRRNFIYWPFFSLSPVFICPLLAITATYYFEKGFLGIPAAFVCLSLFHYYIEGVIWKGGTIHRRYVSFI